MQIEEVAGLQVQQVGVDECLEERRHCEGSCTTRLEVGAGEVVNANTTVLVGVRVAVVAECLCSALDYTRPESCRARPCYNGGRCVEGRFGIRYLIYSFWSLFRISEKNKNKKIIRTIIFCYCYFEIHQQVNTVHDNEPKPLTTTSSTNHITWTPDKMSTWWCDYTWSSN